MNHLDTERMNKPGDSNEKIALLYRVANDFRYHKPDPSMATKFNEIRNSAKALAAIMVTHCPIGRELSSALTRLEESVMHANAGIARQGEPQGEI